MNRKRTEAEWIEIYNEQKEYISILLYNGEQMVQCLDEISFKGRYYYPQWVSTDFGRVYSLARERFLDINQKETGKRRKDGTYPEKYYYIGGKIPAHKLTANYFCDKKIVEIYGEENVEVHHKIAFDPSKSLIENNRASNLCYAVKETHRNTIHPLMNGKMLSNVDENIKQLLPTLADSKSSYIETFVNEGGKESMKISVKPEGKRFDKYLPEAAQQEILKEYGSLMFIRTVKPINEKETRVKFENGDVRIYQK